MGAGEDDLVERLIAEDLLPVAARILALALAAQAGADQAGEQNCEEGDAGRAAGISSRANLLARSTRTQGGTLAVARRLGGVATQRPAKPFTPVRLR